MNRTVACTILAALGLVLAVAAGPQGCGHNDRRDRERCEQCDPAQIDKDCLGQCLQFCAPGEPDCAGRCDRECDRCKAELECRACSANCTGTVSRCAVVGEPLVCEDGTF